MPSDTRADAPIDLTNQFLIAMPGMTDPLFAGTVVYVCEHNERGALGLVINRPIDLDLATLFDKVDLTLEIQPLAQQPVYYGGPVQVDRGFVLHDALGSFSSSLAVPGGLEMTTSKDVLEAVAEGNGPSRFLMALGYAGWGAGQLEEELSQNGWLTVEANKDVIFNVPPDRRQAAALGLLGIDPVMLSGEAGHA